MVTKRSSAFLVHNRVYYKVDLLKWPCLDVPLGYELKPFHILSPIFFSQIL
jgi:hypothetical protein